MRKITLIAVAFLIATGLSAQKHYSGQSLETGPKIEKKVGDYPKLPKAIQGMLQYDNGQLDFGLGNSSPHTIEVYHRFIADDIQGYLAKKITHIQFGLDDASHYTKVVVRILEDSLSATPVINEEVNISDIKGGINTFSLTNSYQIPENTDVYIGVYFESSGGYGIAVDTDGSTHPSNSSLLFFNGSYQGSIAAQYGDFVVRGVITDDGLVEGLIDMSISGLTPKTNDCALTATESIIVTLVNKGDSIINEKFNLTVEINDTPITTQVSPTGFVSGSDFEVEVSSFDMEAFMKYNIKASHDFEDHLMFNDSYETTISTGDATITVELTTDNWPGETSWAIFDKEGEIVAVNGDLSAATKHVDNICVASAGCYSWVIYDSYGDGISDVGGSFSIFYNGVEVGSSPAGGDFGSEYPVFGMGSGCPENEIVLVEFEMPYQMEPQELSIGGTILNMGTDDLISFEAVYVINGDTSEVYTKSSFLLPLGYYYDFTHNVPFNFETPGLYTIELIIRNPNGVVDDETNNNLTQKIIVSTDMVAKKQLFEHFTSSTCAPCASYTPTADELLNANPDNYSLIRYQVNWPGSGDPYYIQQAGDRVKYYGVTGVPSVYRNGNYDMGVTQSGFDTYAADQTVIEIDATGAFKGNNVFVMSDISTYANLPEGLTAHMVVVENQTLDNVGSNGETEWFNVMMQMLPSSKGTTLGELKVDGVTKLIQSYDMSSTFVEEMDDLTAVVFIQDDITKEMLQSEMVPIKEGLSITFNVDMTNAGMVDGDLVYVTGNFTGWVEPGKEGAIVLTDDDKDNIYSATVAVPVNFGEIQYKYFLNAGWDGAEWVGDPNRSVYAVEVDVVVDPADIWGHKTAINENAINAVHMYPNPFNNTLTIENLSAASQVMVSNVLGQTLMTLSVTDATMEISTSELNKGVYLITITDANNNSRTKRVVKK